MKIFLLDMDGTLLDFNRAAQENLKLVLGDIFGARFDEGAARFHEINDELWRALERGEVTRERLRELRFEMLFDEFGLEGDIPALSRRFLANWSKLCFPFDGAKEFVRALSEKGRVYIVTNGATEKQESNMRDAGFLPYLAGAFISEVMQCDKPSDRFCMLVREGIPGYDGAEKTYLGDSLTADLPCAEKLGAAFVCFDPTGKSGYAGRTARNFEEAYALMTGEFTQKLFTRKSK